MGFLDWVEKNRKKSEAYRYRLTILFAFLLTAVIVGLWLTVLVAQKKSPSVSAPSPLALIKDALKIK